MVDFRKFLLVLLVQDWVLQLSVYGQDTFMNALGLCDKTWFGCKCKDSYEWMGQTYSGCINPRLDSGHAQLPWCEVEESCWALGLGFLPRRLVGYQNKYADFCLPGCGQIDEQEKEEIEKEIEQKETVGGCKCAREWYYRGQEYQNCANPNNDPLGSWCVVDENSCSFHIGFCINGFFFGVQTDAAEYCLQKDEEPAAASFTSVLAISSKNDEPQSVPNVSSSTPTPIATPTPSPIATPTPSPIATPTPAPTPAPIKDCESLITILNNTAEFSTFNEVLMETGFDQKAKSLTEQTILVPDNEAWQKFADYQKIDVGDFFLFQSNIEALREIAELHFVTELLNATDTTEKVVQTQLTGQSLTITSEKSQIFIEPPNSDAGLSQIIDVPFEVCEGQFFRVDTVLTPQIVV